MQTKPSKNAPLLLRVRFHAVCEGKKEEVKKMWRTQMSALGLHGGGSPKPHHVLRKEAEGMLCMKKTSLESNRQTQLNGEKINSAGWRPYQSISKIKKKGIRIP